MSSLQRQLRRNLLWVLLLAMAALLLLGNAGVEQMTQQYVLTRLKHDAESLIAALTRDQGGRWTLDTRRMSMVYDRVRSGHYYVVETGAQRFSSRSLWDTRVSIELMAPGQMQSDLAAGPGDEQWLTWAQGARKQDANLTVWVAEDIHPLRLVRYKYTAWAVVLIAATLFVLLAAQQWLLKRGFRQLDHVRESIRAMRRGEDSALQGNVPSEVQPLVDEIDRLLTQLYRRVMRSRNALGNLAHELKRPMQHLTLLVEDLQADKRDELRRALDNIRGLIDRELKRARIVGVSSPGRQMEVARELPPLLDVLKKLYPQRHLTATYPPQLVLPQDRDDLLELLGNLLDNACKFARDQVQLTIAEEVDGWAMTVVDDGPGVSEEQLATLVDRGTRFDESAAGSGLGLAICKDICDSYGGELLFARQPGAGLKIVVFLPRVKAGKTNDY